MEHAEITKLRFDKERSNLEDLPEHIRKPLFTILAQYADGAVKRENRRWIDVKMDEEFLNEANYKWNEK